MKASNNVEIRREVISGNPIHYRSAGKDGDPCIVCLHAIGHSSEDYNFLLNNPPAGFKVIAIDFPGNGKSPLGEQSVSSESYYRLLKEFLLRSEIRNPVVLGNSIGGAVAVRLGADPEIKPRAVVLMDPGGLDKGGGGLFNKLVCKMMVSFFHAGTRKRKWFRSAFHAYYKLVLPSKQAEAARNEIVRNAYEIAPVLEKAWDSFWRDSEDLRPLIAQIDCPVLFCWATRDRFIQLGRNIQAIRKFKNHKLIKYKIGHTPMLECPDRFEKDLKSFLEQNLEKNKEGQLTFSR
ncbi:alpha/beta fold hydrolase [Leptospira perolatii]|nr:alpha/beta hydrolase [Leptospira perolatii]